MVWKMLKGSGMFSGLIAQGLSAFWQDLVAAERRTAERTADRERLRPCRNICRRTFSNTQALHMPIADRDRDNVLDDRQHDVVVAAVEMIAGGDRELTLVRLGARLAETLGPALSALKHTKIADSGRPRRR